ncbi:hypothetical protein FA13DRAFT_1089102 [Coprinellus micaceus]|uniref:Uncharacterized protein n=1 Tax=Coprinellus micaceus TaxID=71717 RepID=A0A4Y7TRQ5_COPMI|nr:hypothetical protein FA13DRAFT_1089102 [Coprinellus micaceus]
MTRRITLLSPSPSPPTPYESKLRVPPQAPPTRHELHLDLAEYQGGNPEPRFLDKIRAPASQGDVDAVVMFDTPDDPMDDIWMALEGAQPWHLEMISDHGERCWYEGLEKVKTPWPLRSVYIGSYNGGGMWAESDDELDDDEDLEDQEYRRESKGDIERASANPATGLKTQPSFPACYSHIEMLVLSFPNHRDLFFYPKGGAQNLRSLAIYDNEAFRTFSCTLTCNPALSDTLESLSLTWPHRYEGESWEEDIKKIKRFFAESKALRNLELFLGPDVIEDPNPRNDLDFYTRHRDTCPYAGLQSCLPPTLEFFSLSAPANRLTLVDIDHWILSAQDPAWLPKLRRAAFSFATDPAVGGLRREEELLLDGKVEMLLDLLGEKGVEIVEPRGAHEQDYPLPLSCY